MSTHSKHTLKLTTLSASLRSMYILRNFIQKHSTAFKYDKDQVEFVIIVQKKKTTLPTWSSSAKELLFWRKIKTENNKVNTAA